MNNNLKKKYFLLKNWGWGLGIGDCGLGIHLEGW